MNTTTTTLAPVSSIFEICELFEIARENCTCQNYPQLCHGGDEYGPTGVTIYEKDPRNTKWITSLIFIISFVGIISNLVVQVVTIKYRQQMNRSNILIGILAFTDMIFSILILMIAIPQFWQEEWIYGLPLCKVILGLELMTALLSINIMLVIAIDRLLILIFRLNLKYPIGKIAIITMVIALMISVGSTIPFIKAVEINKPSGRCYETWDGDRSALLAYQWYIMVAFYIIPAIVISAIYGYLMKYLKEQLTSNVIITSQVMMKKRINDNKRIMRVLLSIMVAFYVLSLPNKAIWIYTSSRESVESNLHTVLMYISKLTYPLHAIVNPFIYTVVDKRFRKNLVQLTESFSRGLSKTESTFAVNERIALTEKK